MAEELITTRPKQARILRLLAENGGESLVTDLCSIANVTRSPVQTLSRDGMIELSWSHVADSPIQVSVEAFPKPELLSREQQDALRAIRQSIRNNENAGYLLYGVTGSGKTEVYLRAIEDVIAIGKSAIILVPEISLTPQTIARFKGRFDCVAVLHSRLSDKERHNQWKLIQSGGADVVVGARSAVFAPLPRLGLLVVDEEHETSFKQQNSPQYHAREVALKRAQIEGAVTIFGSATPSLEVFQYARSGWLKALTLRHRVGGRRFPTVSVVNMGLEKTVRSTFLSEALLSNLSRTLKEKNQAILFLNRRGFHTVLFCGACKETVRCANCDISMTLHRKANRMICHYCGFERLPPPVCPGCSLPRLTYIGAGTERVEHEVQALFPEARIVRMDSDTMIARNAHEQALQRFKNREVDILIGTQMIAKGLDFPGVTLVGVIAADAPLYQPDFRCAERAFQLLSQVSGRAGRGEDSGKVIVQALNVDHYSMQYAIRNDYLSFATQELKARKEAGYPPFARLMRAVFSGENPTEVQALAQAICHAVAEIKIQEQTRILGPAKAPITMINGRYRWHVLVKSPTREDLNQLASLWNTCYKKWRKTQFKTSRMVLDIDPQSML
ncbi:MAG: primosomal protein N' [Planctomycetota bacterium]